MVAELTPRSEELAARGVHDYQQAIQTGYAQEGEVLGKLLIMQMYGKQQLPLQTLRDIFVGAGLSESDAPSPRAGSDAWRLATKALEGAEIMSETGRLKVLVRDWTGSKDPRRDITLERQETDQDRLSYASPAAVITFETKGQRMAWDNRLNPYRDGDAYQLLESLLDGIQDRFNQYKSYVGGEAIYRALRRVIEPTAPLPMGKGAWLIWSEHENVVGAVASVVAALNDFNPGEKQSIANIFTVVNTPQDRQTLSQTLDATIGKEVSEGLERIGRLLSDPERLIDYHATLEREHYDRLQQMVASYQARLKKDTRDITNKLGLLDGMIEDLQTALAKKEAQRRAAQRRRGQ